jgi:hypothetical protein
MHTHYLFIFNKKFWVGPAQPTCGWAGPSQPGQVTGPSQWPGWAKTKSTRELVMRARTLVKVIKLPSHSVLVTLTITFWNEDAKGMKSYLLLETENVYSADDDSRLLFPLVFLLWSHVCAFLLAFSVAFKTTKMMPVCCECSLNEYGSFLCLQGRRQFQR